MKKMWPVFVLFIIGVVLISFGSVKHRTAQTAGDATANSPKALPADTVTASDAQEGNPSASVTLVEFSDFQCPACRAFRPITDQLIKNYGDKIRLVYKYYPLSQHVNAWPSAYAGEAAQRQGKFSAMADLLFTNQDDWGTLPKPQDVFIGYAKTLGLDIDQFTKDIASKEVKDRVTSTLNLGQTVGILGTPTFYLNGILLETPQSYVEFEKIIKKAIAPTA